MIKESSINLKNNSQNKFKKYFEPSSNEEDYPIEIDEIRQSMMPKIEEIFSDIYDEHSLSIAKVRRFYFILIIQSKPRKMKEKRKN